MANTPNGMSAEDRIRELELKLVRMEFEFSDFRSKSIERECRIMGRELDINAIQKHLEALIRHLGLESVSHGFSFIKSKQ